MSALNDSGPTTNIPYADLYNTYKCLLYGIEFGQNDFLVMRYVRSSRK